MALVHSTENQIAFVLHEVLRVVSLELNRNLRVKKCLFSSDTKDDLTGQSSRNSTGTADNVDVNTDSDDVLSKLNIDGLKTCEGRSSLKSLKVLLVHPNGSIVIVTRNPTNEKTVQIIRNLVVGGWTAVANAVFDHPVTNALHTFSNRRC